MFRNKNEQGLTLIELLITISVLAVVSAIALPVINNVVTSSNSNALQQSIKDAQAFIDRYSKGGVVVYDGLQTLAGYVDTDGDNIIDENEKIDTLTLDSKYSMTPSGTTTHTLGTSQYSNGGVTGVTITSNATGGTTQPTTTVFATGNFESWNNPAVRLVSWSPVQVDTSVFMIQRYGDWGTFQVGDQITISNAYLTSTGDPNIDAYLTENQNVFNGTWTIVSKDESMGDRYYLQHTSASSQVAQTLANAGMYGVMVRGDWSAAR